MFLLSQRIRKRRQREWYLRGLRRQCLVYGGIRQLIRDQAAHQRRRQEGAVRDNFQLRLAEEQQRKVADFLKKLIQKRASQLVRQQTVGNIVHHDRLNWFVCAVVDERVRLKRNAVDALNCCGDVEDLRGLGCQLEAAYGTLCASPHAFKAVFSRILHGERVLYVENSRYFSATASRT